MNVFGDRPQTHLSSTSALSRAPLEGVQGGLLNEATFEYVVSRLVVAELKHVLHQCGRGRSVTGRRNDLVIRVRECWQVRDANGVMRPKDQSLSLS